MQTYYLHDGTALQGPFSGQDLAAQNITATTYVWVDGSESWQAAGEIAELKALFIPQPPPVVPQAPPSQAVAPPPTVVPSASSNVGGWLIAFVICAVVLGGAYIYFSENTAAEAAQERIATEKAEAAANERRKQAAAAEQAAAAQQQEAARQAEERRQVAVAAEKQLLTDKINYSRNLLAIAKDEIDKIREFQLLRSPEERAAQIAEKQHQIDLLTHKIEELQKQLAIL